MNKLLLLLSALVVLGASCSKKDSHRDTASVIGYDGTMCGCCLGFMIKMDGDNTNTYYLARSLPASAGINPTSTFPIRVEVDYEKNDANCEQVIMVTRLERK